MTAQVSDLLIYEGCEYQLVGAPADALFQPAARGLEPFSTCTGCWLGCQCVYEVTDGRLLLAQLRIGLRGDAAIAAEKGEGAPLFGVRPKPWDGMLPFVYDGLAAPLDFTGALTIGDDFIWDMYVHMGYPPPHKFRVVRELTFEKGRLLSDIDRSEDMAALREALGAGGMAGLFGAPLRPS